MLCRGGEASCYRVLLIHRVLTPTSMQPKPPQPVLGSLAQLRQEASKTASAAELLSDRLIFKCVFDFALKL